MTNDQESTGLGDALPGSATAGNQVPLVFIARPLDTRLKHVYSRVLWPVIEQVGLQHCFYEESYSIGTADLDKLKNQINDSELFICDLTFESPFAFYLLGIAHALGKASIVISQSAANLCFDIQTPNIIQYEDTNTGLLDLRDRLTEFLSTYASERYRTEQADGKTVSREVSYVDLAIQRRNLFSSSPNTRRFAIRFLGAHKDAEAFPLIVQIIYTENDPNVLRDAVTSVFLIDPAKARPVLLEKGLREQPEYLVRERVVGLLGSEAYQPPDAELVDQMIEQLDDSSWGVRQAVCKVLGQWGNLEAIAPLQQRINDPQLQVRVAAAEAFERLEQTRVEVEASLQEIELSGEQVNALHKKAIREFNIDELKELCFELSIDYEDLSGSTKSDKIRELIDYCQRRGRINELLIAYRRARPNSTIWRSIQGIGQA